MPFGGFFIRGSDFMAAEGYKRKLTTMLSADLEGYLSLNGDTSQGSVILLHGVLVPRNRSGLGLGPGEEY
jgi:hypothetical protein